VEQRPLLGWISRQRFRLVVELLPKASIVRLLEIGYGSGVFLPELARYSQEIFGVDVHAECERVARCLAKMNVRAELHSASAVEMPFAGGHFDVVVSVSCLEFISDLPAAVGEIARVLAPNGTFIVVTPNQSKIADAGLRMLTGRNAEADFKGGRRQVIPAVMQHFEVEYCLGGRRANSCRCIRPFASDRKYCRPLYTLASRYRRIPSLLLPTHSLAEDAPE
jgi:SAM-dependent methyltransferase